MAYPEQHFVWTWQLAASPEALWPLVANTDRFNRDCGYPPVTVVAMLGGKTSGPAGRRLRARRYGVRIEWNEHPFEWVVNRRFGVERVFAHGPFSRIRALCELAPRAPAGTTLTYQAWFTPVNVLGRLALRFGVAAWQFRRPFQRVFAHYDELARQGLTESNLAKNSRLSPGGASRLTAIKQTLLTDARQPASLVDKLATHVATVDDLDGQRIRAYALADQWHSSRREILKLCLHATRAGLLDLRWDVLCPHCRGAKAVNASLATLKADAFCETCQVDFVADFEKSVELTFTPNPAIRRVPRTNYCVGGPQVTPHIVAQQTLAPGETKSVSLDVPPGRYRVRAPALATPRFFHIEEEGVGKATIVLATESVPSDERALAPGAELALINRTGEPQVAVVEHVAWSDQATMASEVTSLQLFRDLFAREVLRPGGQISVNSLTIVFTDLKGSTQMYRDIGDAPAFSRVLTHFEVLKAAVESEGGAIVKTMGDAIMAIFPRPVPALRAMLAAQRQLALAQSAPPWDGPTGIAPLPGPLALKAGVHYGPCIAINQNERLDYFGTTVNVAARLCGLCTGTDLVISEAVGKDPEVVAWLAEPATRIQTAIERTSLRGIAGETFEVCRVSRK
jgi:class 3 adenylate cyclase